MPTVPGIGSFRFHFYSDEYKEPAHIHIATPDGECKFWLNPVLLAEIMVFPHTGCGKLKNWFMNMKSF